MKKQNLERKKTGPEIAQEIQDEIFRKMSPDKKMKVFRGMWKLAKDLINNDTVWRKIIQTSDFEK